MKPKLLYSGEYIYNYIDFEGLKCLAENGEWKVSKPEDMNDYREKKSLNCNFERESPKFSCFSASELIPPMWYFYAGKYQGVCMEFDAKKICQDGLTLTPIRYLSLNEYSDSEHIARNTMDFFTIKESAWSYEQEVRLFLSEGQTFDFRKYLSRIIVMYQNDKMDEIKNICLKMGVEVHATYPCPDGRIVKPTIHNKTEL